MQQQSVDVSADNEVMAILSSPVQTFVVKPQARPGGVASAAGALGPLSPKSNGQAAHAAAGLALLVGGADYLADGGAHDGVVGQGKGGDMAGGSGAAPLGAPGISPPHTPGPPKSNSASWDPQSQSASSAFSVPAGRGGGRGDGAGAGRGGSVGNSAFGALKLGSFRVVGGDLVNRGSIQVRSCVLLVSVECRGVEVRKLLKMRSFALQAKQDDYVAGNCTWCKSLVIAWVAIRYSRECGVQAVTREDVRARGVPFVSCVIANGEFRRSLQRHSGDGTYMRIHGAMVWYSQCPGTPMTVIHARCD